MLTRMKFAMVVLGLSLGLAVSAEEIHFLKGKALPVRGNPRTVLRIDPVELQLIQGSLDTSSWHEVFSEPGKPFVGPAFNSGYAYFEVNSAQERWMLLEAKGHSMVYVNDLPRVGDIYSFGYVSLPVKLQRGVNRFLFATGRGGFTGKLVEPKIPVQLEIRDLTTPDIIQGEKQTLTAAIIVQNATDQDLSNLTLEANGIATRVPKVLSGTMRKVGFQLKPNATGKFSIRLKEAGKVLDTKDLTLRLRTARQTHKRTFTSDVDGSVQYYAVTPSSQSGDGQALFLSLHGASVEALNQAESYGAKSWGHVVCPTNRRPFGFDWEDVGRTDALEVLAHAKSLYRTDPSRTYLTGHSMGGHGTWQLGALFPDRFAAIAPCAGWISFSTYANGATYPNTPLGDLLRRAGNTSDTLLHKPNLLQNPIFILHGDADDNVPVQQARTMREELKIHKALQWHEEPGQGHWYDTDPEPGANVQDHAPIYDMFAKARIPSDAEVKRIDFVTTQPSVNGKCYWLEVERQEQAGAPSSVTADLRANLGTITLRTTNVRTLSVSTAILRTKDEFEVDWNGSKFKVKTTEIGPDAKKVILHNDGKTVRADYATRFVERDPSVRGVFANQVMFVYQDSGASAEETRWAKNKAIYDAEQFWYRGNASVDVVPMSRFGDYLAKSKAKIRNNVIVYSANSGFVRDWANQLEASCPESLRVGPVAREEHFPGTAVIDTRVWYTASGQPVQAVLIGGDSVAMARLTERIPLFSAGCAIPTTLAFDRTMLEKGIDGVVAARLGADWYRR
jgi:poly(3-hydroxybutyrate) depolymerase